MIRRRAIQELDTRGDGQLLEFAEKMQSNPDERAENRLFAVGIILRERGTKGVPKLRLSKLTL